MSLQPITINPHRIDLDEAYMQMAEIWAKRSKANRKQVGALIVKDKQIISDGYNGLPAGEADDVCEVWHQNGLEYELSTKPEVLHAESNAIAKLAENGGVGGQGATLYVTMSPCRECAKLIKQTKIKRVVFREQYRDGGGIEFLVNRGVEVLHLSRKQVSSTLVVHRVSQPELPAPAQASPTLPPLIPSAAPIVNEDEVVALLRAHEAQLLAQRSPVGVAPAVASEAPYRSSFL